MYMRIKPRKLGEKFTFYMPNNGGHIHVEIEETAHRTPVRQICHGGGFLGDTISSTPESFATACRAWYRSYVRRQQNY